MKNTVCAVFWEFLKDLAPAFSVAAAKFRLLAIRTQPMLGDRRFDRAAELAADQPAVLPRLPALDGILVEAPALVRAVNQRARLTLSHSDPCSSVTISIARREMPL